MVLLIDNYDSFTYNLVQQIGAFGTNIEVVRNDKITIAEIEKKNPSHIIISPGPCTPKEGGISNSVIKDFAGKIPLLGVCLGHQCIGTAYGGRIVQAKRLMHGKTSFIQHDRKGIFDRIENPFVATRYHSLVIDRKTLPGCLKVIAWTKDRDKEIMGIKHKDLTLWGVQFHPESILTVAGKSLLKNFLRLR